MRKLLMTFTVLAGTMTAMASGAQSRPIDMPLQLGPVVQLVPVQYRGEYYGDWRAREWHRREAWERWRRHQEWERWHRYHGW